MTQTLPKTLTFEEFVEWLPENTGTRYELHDGINCRNVTTKWEA